MFFIPFLSQPIGANMFGKVETGGGVPQSIRSMKLEPLEVIRGGTVTCVFAAEAGKDVNVLVYSVLDQQTIEEFSMTGNGNFQNFKVNTSPLSPGEYMIKVQSGRDFRSGKFNVV
jgi:hypothetical protein